MGTKTTESSQSGSQSGTVRTGAVSGQESQLQQLLMQLAGGVSGQFSDISDIAAGDILDIPEDIKQKIGSIFQEKATSERRGAEMDFRDILQGQGDYFAKRGVQDSSMERVGVGRAYAGHYQNLQDIESRRAGGVAETELQLPFQLAQSRLQGTQALGGVFGGFANPLLENWLRTRLSNIDSSGTSVGTGTEETSGFTLGELAGLSGFAGAL